MKKSEFYAAMCICIILCSMSTVFAVSYQPQIIQPTKIGEALTTTTNTATNTYITLLDLTGKGILSRVRILANVDLNNQMYMRVTVDGGTPVELAPSAAFNIMRSASYGYTTATVSDTTIEWLGTLYFNTSIKVEAKHSYNGNCNYKCQINYATE